MFQWGGMVFDSGDLNYLANNLSAGHLRYMIAKYRLLYYSKGIVWDEQRQERDYETEWHERAFYEDFLNACQSALKIKQNTTTRSPAVLREIRLSAEEIKAKVDIVDYIGQYVNLIKSGRSFKAPCPFHSEKSPSFMVYPENRTWHCYGACNTGGDVITFTMKYQGVDFKAALYQLSR